MRATRTSTTRLTMAARCRVKRRRIRESWLRSLTVNSRSTLPPPGPRGVGMLAGVKAWPGGVWTGKELTSLIADPRVEHGVEQVGHDVSDDHERTCREHPGEHRVPVAGADRLHQEGTHAAPLEDRLGHH